MKLPDAIEREIQSIEADYVTGQQAGPPRLRGLRSAIEAELQSRAEASKVWSAMTPDERLDVFLAWRSIETCCNKCQGTGKVTYGSTSTWRGGIGGSAMTTDVCTGCWGSGCTHRPGADLRRLFGEIDILRSKVKQMESKQCTS